MQPFIGLDTYVPCKKGVQKRKFYTYDEMYYHQLQMIPKHAVVSPDERFEYAKNCRDAVGLLHKAGLRLGKYHIEKRMAIEEESYDRAKLKKDHAEEYKEAVMESLRIDQLLESDGVGRTVANGPTCF